MSTRIVKLTALSSVALLALASGCSSADTSTGTVPAEEGATHAAAQPGADAVTVHGTRGNNERVDQSIFGQLAPAPEGAVSVAWTREEQAKRDLAHAGVHPEARRSPLMTNHGGKIMTTAVTKNIFWGTSWGTYVGDKITGLDTWYTGYSGSNYAKTSTEYTSTNGRVGSVTTHQGHVIDTSVASGGANTATILAEVCKQVTAGNIVPDAGGNGYYAVYTDVPRGTAGYCAYHSAGTCSGQTLQFAFFWKLDGDAGCDPSDGSGLHSQGLAALANVTGHELAEAMTDPANPGAWYDSSGSENGDKCAWTWGGPLATFSNGSQWKVQGEWSNAAFTAGTGYPNSAGQHGCLGGL